MSDDVREPADGTAHHASADDDALPRAAVERPVAERLGLTPSSEVVRAALNRAQAAARARGLRPGQPARDARRRNAATDERSGPGRDGRDPVTLGDMIQRFTTERGWTTELSVNGVIGRWAEVVGEETASHTVVESFEDGVLVVRADSTAWAENLRLYLSTMRRLVEDEVGEGAVREIRVLGPAGPQWGKGRRRVAGRGPRDTYG